MITFQEAQDLVLSSLRPVASEKIEVSDSLQRILSTDVISPLDVPSFNNSAVDGYAARAEDLKKTPVTLKVIEKIPAGKVPQKKLSRGCCSQIMTGAPLPYGSDCVVMVEDTQRYAEDLVSVLRPVKKWENVRFAGEDIKKGRVILSKGTMLTPSAMGVLTSIGISRVDVYRKVRVGFLTTGDEVIMPPEKLQKGQIYNSNYTSLLGAITSVGAIPIYFGHKPDALSEVIRSVRLALKEVDVLLTSGGVSMGDYDVLKESFKALGVHTVFEKVNIKPARPTVFAKFGDKLIFGLPGNPVSTLVAFELFVKPAILKISGVVFNHKRVKAFSEFTYTKKDTRTHFLRGILSEKKGVYTVKLTSTNQGSAILTSLVKSNCFVVIPGCKSKVVPGDIVEVLKTDQI